MAQEIHYHAFALVRVLVKYIDDNRAFDDQIHDLVQRTPLAQGAQPGLLEAPRDKIVEPLRAQWPPHKVKQVFVLGKLLNARDRGYFPISKMTGQQENAFAFVVDSQRRLN